MGDEEVDAFLGEVHLYAETWQKERLTRPLSPLTECLGGWYWKRNIGVTANGHCGAGANSGSLQ